MIRRIRKESWKAEESARGAAANVSHRLAHWMHGRPLPELPLDLPRDISRHSMVLAVAFNSFLEHVLGLLLVCAFAVCACFLCFAGPPPAARNSAAGALGVVWQWARRVWQTTSAGKLRPARHIEDSATLLFLWRWLVFLLGEASCENESALSNKNKTLRAGLGMLGGLRRTRHQHVHLTTILQSFQA